MKMIGLAATVSVMGLIVVGLGVAAASTIDSSTMYFRGDFVSDASGGLTGTIPMTAGNYYIPGDPGESIWDQGGSDVYAKEGGSAYHGGTAPSPMSGTLTWHGDGTAAETDMGHNVGTNHGGGVRAQAGDGDWGWGVNVVALEYPGFDVVVVQSGSYDVSMGPHRPEPTTITRLVLGGPGLLICATARRGRRR